MILLASVLPAPDSPQTAIVRTTFHDTHRNRTLSLTRNDNYGIARVIATCSPCRVGDREHMGRSFVQFSALVLFDRILFVNGQLSVGVDRNQHLSDVRINAGFVESAKEERKKV